MSVNFMFSLSWRLMPCRMDLAYAARGLHILVFVDQLPNIGRCSLLLLPLMNSSLALSTSGLFHVLTLIVRVHGHKPRIGPPCDMRLLSL